VDSYLLSTTCACALAELVLVLSFAKERYFLYLWVFSRCVHVRVHAYCAYVWAWVLRYLSVCVYMREILCVRVRYSGSEPREKVGVCERERDTSERACINV